MTYECHFGDAFVQVSRGGQVLASVELHEGPGVVFLTSLASHGDPGALKALIRETCNFVRWRDVYLAVDASDANARRLCMLYRRFARPEYIMFKVVDKT